MARSCSEVQQSCGRDGIDVGQVYAGGEERPDRAVAVVHTDLRPYLSVDDFARVEPTMKLCSGSRGNDGPLALFKEVTLPPKQDHTARQVLSSGPGVGIFRHPAVTDIGVDRSDARL